MPALQNANAGAQPDESEIDIAFGANANYLPHVAAVMDSLVRHTPGARFRFILLHDGADEALRTEVEAAAPGARFVWLEIGDDDIPAFKERGHLNRAALFRLGLEQLGPADCGRVIYLDADIAVLGDVRDLWRFDLGGAPLAAVVDSYVDAAGFAARWGLTHSASGYFNSGVMVIDLERVRATRLFSNAIALMSAHGHEFQFADQDALNIATWGVWRALPPRWNAQLDMVAPWLAPGLAPELQFHDRLPELVHFTGAEKPWVRGAFHPWAWLYWRHVLRTPFAARVRRAAGLHALAQVRVWLRWLRRKPRGASA